MDINAEKAILIQEIQQVEDVALLNAIKIVLHYGMQNEGRISIEQYNKEIAEAEERIDSGDFVTHEEAIHRIRAWRKTGS
jgi:hypothetical protein